MSVLTVERRSSLPTRYLVVHLPPAPPGAAELHPPACSIAEGRGGVVAACWGSAYVGAALGEGPAAVASRNAERMGWPVGVAITAAEAAPVA
eukprot:355264-Chlamydomonas_euryale.AAC.3